MQVFSCFIKERRVLNVKKTYKKPGVAIADYESGKIISNSAQMEEVLKRYCSETQQKVNGEDGQLEETE